jgi:hypothetical protein
MHKEEEWTLSRIASQQQHSRKASESKTTVQAPAGGEQTMGVPGAASNGSPSSSTPQRRRFVFTDPVAFRYALLVSLHKVESVSNEAVGISRKTHRPWS